MGNEELKRRFSLAAPAYDNIVAQGHYQAYRRLPRRILSKLKTDSAKILDLGCGTGLGSLPFFEQGFEVTGIDFAEGMVRRAAYHPFKRLVCQDVETELPVSDEEFDAVILLGVLDFVEDPEALLDQIYRKLRSGGLCGLTIPQRRSEVSVTEVKDYTTAEVERLLTNSRFEIIECREIFGCEVGNEKIYYWEYLLRK
ncbi:MAG: class I SAM-dependent methyltransferase [bacterium]|nr:class I SAM-dependent methyltransferase [bacterium]